MLIVNKTSTLSKKPLPSWAIEKLKKQGFQETENYFYIPISSVKHIRK
jgi:hypothetical protein